MLRQLDRNLWVAEQPLKFLGLEVGTRMTVIRLADNSLVLISPIKIDQQLKQQLDHLGSVEYLVAPNLFHYLYLAQSQQQYPTAQAIAPPGLAAKQPELNIDQVLTQDQIKFADELEYTLFEGFQVFIPPKIAVVNEVVFFHRDSQTLIITDSAFNFDRSFPIVTQLATRVLGSYGVLKPTWLEKIAVRERQKLQESSERILQWDFQRIVMAHGQIVEQNAPTQLAEGYRWLWK
ncbi:MAG: DUF4336 domain-containing protein [Cyanobacteria bacterium J06643_13]